MKRIFAFILCLMLLCVTPLVASAEVEGEMPTENETVTEGEISPPVETPEETPDVVPEEAPNEEAEPDWDEVQQTISDKIVNWILPHIEEISVIITLFLTIIYNIRRNKVLDKSVGALNNNAITIAQATAEAMDKASGAVTGYSTDIVALLERFRNTAEDRQRLETELLEIHKALKLAKEANVEFANELAELLALANIPNYKKEEIGARHLAAVKALVEIEAKTETEEVNKDVGEET